MPYPWIKQANSIFLAVLSGQFVLSLIIAFFTDSFVEGVVGSLVFLSLPVMLIFTAPYAASTRIAVGIAVQLMTALHIQQAAGLTEIHFEIFVMLAFLSFYRDWRVVLASLLVVAVHHVLFFVLQSQGSSLTIFEAGHLSFGILVVHALFAIMESVVLMFVASQIHKEAVASHALSDSIHQVLAEEGKFDLTVEVDRNDRRLAEFVLLMDSFRSLITRAKDTNNEVCDAAHQVEQLTAEISQGSTFNTSQVTSIATAIEEMSVTNQDVANRAAEANSLSKESNQNTRAAKDTIQKSSEEIVALDHDLHDAAQTAEQLAEMCSKINDAMASIKTVADQTNLLALNAAIESARAGEHGRGFAVVADEVRQLANTTGTYADEISAITGALIDEAKQSVGKINQCVDRAENTKTSSAGATGLMDEVSSYTVRLDQNIDSVATAVEEQSAVSEDIARSAQQLSESNETQQEKIHTSADAIGGLLGNIEALDKELTRFTV